MQKKNIIITVLVILAVGIIGYMLYPEQPKAIPANIISLNQKIPIQDVKIFLKGFPYESTAEDHRKYFSKELINLHTVRFFNFIQSEIEYTNREGHLQAVKTYLYSILDPQKAKEMFVLYEKFLDCEIGIHEKTKSCGEPKTADELLRYLKFVQDYRRKTFGVDFADAMWGAEVKANEYAIRKNSIKTDPNLYGAEKEKRINELKNEILGPGAALMEDRPLSDPEQFASYQEKQALYQRDLEELPAAQRFEKIKELWRPYFSSNHIAGPEQVHKEPEAQKNREADYNAQAKAIVNDSGIAADKKAEAIRKLQDNIFGEEADAFRRRLNIKK